MQLASTRGCSGNYLWIYNTTFEDSSYVPVGAVYFASKWFWFMKIWTRVCVHFISFLEIRKWIQIISVPTAGDNATMALSTKVLVDDELLDIITDNTDAPKDQTGNMTLFYSASSKSSCSWYNDANTNLAMQPKTVMCLWSSAMV